MSNNDSPQGSPLGANGNKKSPGSPFPQTKFQTTTGFTSPLLQLVGSDSKDSFAHRLAEESNQIFVSSRETSPQSGFAHAPASIVRNISHENVARSTNSADGLPNPDDPSSGSQKGVLYKNKMKEIIQRFDYLYRSDNFCSSTTEMPIWEANIFNGTPCTPPTALDFAMFDLDTVRESLLCHLSRWSVGEIQEKFRNLVELSVIMEKKDRLFRSRNSLADLEEADCDVDAETESSISNANRSRAKSDDGDGDLNQKQRDTVAASWHLQKARRQLIWEYERIVLHELDKRQAEKFLSVKKIRDWRKRDKSVFFRRSLASTSRSDSRDFTSLQDSRQKDDVSISEEFNDEWGGYMGRKSDSSSKKQSISHPIYCNSSIANRRDSLGSFALRGAAPDHCLQLLSAWELDLYDDLYGTLITKDWEKGTGVLSSLVMGGVIAPEEGAILDKDIRERPTPDLTSLAPAMMNTPGGISANFTSQRNSKARQNDSNIPPIPLPVFVYVMSRLLFRLRYEKLFPAGIFVRQFVDRNSIPEPCQRVHEYYTTRSLKQSSDEMEKHEARKEEFSCDEDSLLENDDRPSKKTEDMLAYHGGELGFLFDILCRVPPKGKSKKEGVTLDELSEWPEAKRQNQIIMRKQRYCPKERREYIQFIRRTAEDPAVLERISTLFDQCRTVAYEWFMLNDTEQRGAVQWNDIVDSLIEYADVQHQRSKVEEHLRQLQTNASIFDRYHIQNWPQQLLRNGYTGALTEVRPFGSYFIVEGPYDYALCQVSEIDHTHPCILTKLLVRTFETIHNDVEVFINSVASDSQVKKARGAVTDYDAALAAKPWQNGMKLGNHYVRFKDEKEIANVSAKNSSASKKTNLNSNGTHGKDGNGTQSSSTSQTATGGTRIDRRGKVLLESSACVTDLFDGMMPSLFTLNSDLTLRLYTMRPSRHISIPEAALWRCPETITALDWLGSASTPSNVKNETLDAYGPSAILHDKLLKHLFVLGTRSGKVLMVDVKSMLLKVPLLWRANCNLEPISIETLASAPYDTLLGSTHIGTVSNYICYTKELHESIVTSVSMANINNTTIMVTTSLDGYVITTKVSFAAPVVGMEPSANSVSLVSLRRLLVCESGIRRALITRESGFIAAYTSSNRVFLLGGSSHIRHVELTDFMAPHFFPLISMVLVEDLDQLITADVSGFVKVWSISRCAPITSFYALSAEVSEGADSYFSDSELAGETVNGNGDTADAEEDEIDAKSDVKSKRQAKATLGDSRVGSVMVKVTRESIEAAAELKIRMQFNTHPIRSFLYDYNSKRCIATGLQNAVLCTFVSGQGATRAHNQWVRNIFLCPRHGWIVSLSSSDCRVWRCDTASLSLGIRANNREYNLLQTERAANSVHKGIHDQLKSADGSTGSIGSWLASFAERNNCVLRVDGFKLPAQEINDVIRAVLLSESCALEQERARLRNEQNIAATIKSAAGAETTATNKQSNLESDAFTSGETGRKDNVRNNNANTNGDILCSCIDQRERFVFYAISNGDIRVHRTETGRLVKTFLTTPPLLEDLLTATLQYKDLHKVLSIGNIPVRSESLSNGKGMLRSNSGGRANSTEPNSLPLSNSPNNLQDTPPLLASIGSAKRIETVTLMLQRILCGTDIGSSSVATGTISSIDKKRSKFSVLESNTSRKKTTFQREAVNMLCLDSVQELCVIYADGVLRFFSLIGHTVHAHRTLIPDYIVAKAVYYLTQPVPRPRYRSSVLRSLVSSSSLQDGGTRQNSKGAASSARSGLPERCSNNSSPPTPQEVVSSTTIANADAISIVAVSPHLQLICVIHVNGLVTIFDVGGFEEQSVQAGGLQKNLGMVASIDSGSRVGIGNARAAHVFSTLDEITCASFLGAYPCLVLGDIRGRVCFYLVRGSSLLALVDDFYQAIFSERMKSQEGRAQQRSVGSNSIMGSLAIRMEDNIQYLNLTPLVWVLNIHKTNGLTQWKESAQHGLPKVMGARRASHFPDFADSLSSQGIPNGNNHCQGSAEDPKISAERPTSLHFDSYYGVLYVGTSDGFIHSYLLGKFLIAMDLRPLVGFGAAGVSLETYMFALKQQQRYVNEEAVRNTLLILFGITPDMVTERVLERRRRATLNLANSPVSFRQGASATPASSGSERQSPLTEKEAECRSEVSTSTSPGTQSLKNMSKDKKNANKGAATSKKFGGTPKEAYSKVTWRNSLLWAYQNCKDLFVVTSSVSNSRPNISNANLSRPVSPSKYPQNQLGRDESQYACSKTTFEAPDPNKFIPVIDLRTATLSDLLVSVAVLHDSIHFLSIKYQHGQNPLPNFRECPTPTNLNEEFSAIPSTCAAVELSQNDIEHVREWIRVGLVEHRAASPWIHGASAAAAARVYENNDASSLNPQSNSAFARLGQGKKSPQAFLSAATSGSPTNEFHPLMSFWAEPLFTRHVLFMRSNCPLVLLSPPALLERARQEARARQRYADAVIAEKKAGNASSRSTSNDKDSALSNEAIPYLPWDEFIEGTIPSLFTEAFRKPGAVFQELNRLSEMRAAVSSITSRRNGYIYIGTVDGSISLWTPYAAARIEHICPNAWLPNSIRRIAASIKKQFQDCVDRIVVQRKRQIFERRAPSPTHQGTVTNAQGQLPFPNTGTGEMALGRLKGPNQAKAEPRTLARGITPATLTKDGVDFLDREKRSSISQSNNTSEMQRSIKMLLLQHEVERMKKERERLQRQTSKMNIGEILPNDPDPQEIDKFSDMRELLQLTLGLLQQDEIEYRRITLEDMYFLPLRYVDLAEIESFELEAYCEAVDRSCNRLLNELCGSEGNSDETSALRARKTITIPEEDGEQGTGNELLSMTTKDRMSTQRKSRAKSFTSGSLVAISGEERAIRLLQCPEDKMIRELDYVYFTHDNLMMECVREEKWNYAQLMRNYEEKRRFASAAKGNQHAASSRAEDRAEGSDDKILELPVPIGLGDHDINTIRVSPKAETTQVDVPDNREGTISSTSVLTQFAANACFVPMNEAQRSLLTLDRRERQSFRSITVLRNLGSGGVHSSALTAMSSANTSTKAPGLNRLDSEATSPGCDTQGLDTSTTPIPLPIPTGRKGFRMDGSSTSKDAEIDCDDRLTNQSFQATKSNQSIHSEDRHRSEYRDREEIKGSCKGIFQSLKKESHRQILYGLEIDHENLLARDRNSSEASTSVSESATATRNCTSADRRQSIKPNSSDDDPFQGQFNKVVSSEEANARKRAEAWLLSSTYGLQQPLLLVNPRESTERATGALQPEIAADPLLQQNSPFNPFLLRSSSSSSSPKVSTGENESENSQITTSNMDKLADHPYNSPVMIKTRNLNNPNSISVSRVITPKRQTESHPGSTKYTQSPQGGLFISSLLTKSDAIPQSLKLEHLAEKDAPQLSSGSPGSKNKAHCPGSSKEFVLSSKSSPRKVTPPKSATPKNRINTPTSVATPITKNNDDDTFDLNAYMIDKEGSPEMHFTGANLKVDTISLPPFDSTLNSQASAINEIKGFGEKRDSMQAPSIQSSPRFAMNLPITGLSTTSQPKKCITFDTNDDPRTGSEVLIASPKSVDSARRNLMHQENRLKQVICDVLPSTETNATVVSPYTELAVVQDMNYVDSKVKSISVGDSVPNPDAALNPSPEMNRRFKETLKFKGSPNDNRNSTTIPTSSDLKTSSDLRANRKRNINFGTLNTKDFSNSSLFDEKNHIHAMDLAIGDNFLDFERVNKGKSLADGNFKEPIISMDGFPQLKWSLKSKGQRTAQLARTGIARSEGENIGDAGTNRACSPNATSERTNHVTGGHKNSINSIHYTKNVVRGCAFEDLIARPQTASSLASAYIPSNSDAFAQLYITTPTITNSPISTANTTPGINLNINNTAVFSGTPPSNATHTPNILYTNTNPLSNDGSENSHNEILSNIFSRPYTPAISLEAKKILKPTPPPQSVVFSASPTTSHGAAKNCSRINTGRENSDADRIGTARSAFSLPMDSVDPRCPSRSQGKTNPLRLNNVNHNAILNSNLTTTNVNNNSNNSNNFDDTISSRHQASRPHSIQHSINLLPSSTRVSNITDNTLKVIKRDGKNNSEKQNNNNNNTIPFGMDTINGQNVFAATYSGQAGADPRISKDKLNNTHNPSNNAKKNQKNQPGGTKCRGNAYGIQKINELMQCGRRS